jgi:hypothetical protein
MTSCDEPRKSSGMITLLVGKSLELMGTMVLDQLECIGCHGHKSQSLDTAVLI